jgi:hypothetical protein
MNKLVLKSIDLIDVDADDNRNENSGIFGFEPTLKEEEPLGSIFLIGETIKGNENSSYIINLIASIIKKEYYANTKETVERALEASLKKANESLSDLKKQGNEELVNSLRFIVASFTNATLNISQIGKVQSLIIRDGEITDIGENIPNKDEKDDEVYFSNIASGEIMKDDTVILSSSPLNEDRIATIQDGFKGNKNFDKIEETIRRKFVNFGEVILILKAMIGQEPTNNKLTPLAGSSDIPLNPAQKKDESNIESILENMDNAKPSIPPKNQDFNQTKSMAALKSELLSDDIGKNANFEDNSLIKRSADDSNVKKSKFGDLKNKFWKKPSRDDSRINNRNNDVSSINSLSNKPDSSKKKDWMKYVYLVGIILIFGVLIFLGYLTYKKIFDTSTPTSTKSTKTTTTDNIPASLTELQKVLDSKDYTKARTLVTQIRSDISKTKSDKKSDYEKQLNEMIAVIDLIKDVKFEQLTTITTEQAPSANSGLAIYNKKAYYSSETGLMSYSLSQTGEIAQVNKDFEYQDAVAVRSMDSGSIFLATDTKSAIYNITNNSLKKVTLSSQSELNYKIVASFNNNIYIASKDNKSIVKFSYNSTGFAPGKVWTDKLPGTALKDLAIDGSVYTLDEVGQIAKYRTGSAEDFKNPNLIDELKGTVSMYTDDNLKNLYLLDSTIGRIVIINKETNNLVAQLKSDQIKDALSSTVYYSNKTITVLTKKALLKYDISTYEE